LGLGGIVEVGGMLLLVDWKSLYRLVGAGCLLLGGWLVLLVVGGAGLMLVMAQDLAQDLATGFLNID
jgi:hypothetical protein